MDHLTFGQQVVMGLIHGGVPSAFITVIGAVILYRLKQHAVLHEELNGGLETRIKKAVKAALKTDEDA